MSLSNPKPIPGFFKSVQFHLLKPLLFLILSALLNSHLYLWFYPPIALYFMNLTVIVNDIHY